MKIKKIGVWIICILIVLLTLKSAFAESPFINNGEFADGLTIEYIPYESIKVDQDYKLHIHVFNSSNGYPMKNDTTSCLIHIYNKTGNHVLEEDFGFDSNEIDFDLYIASGNFSKIGEYGYIIQCNTSNTGGFISGIFYITKSGDDAFQKENNISFLIIFGMFSLFFISLIVALFVAKSVWLKSCLSIALSIIVMTLLRFTSWIVEIINPFQTNLINTLDHYYMFGIWGFRITMIAGMFIVLIIILNSLKMNKTKKRDNWENWNE